MGRGPAWDRAEDDTLTALRAAGASSKAIAVALGRTVPAVVARASRLGLPRRTASTEKKVRVTVEMLARLLPSTGKSAAIREALELRQRMAPQRGLPPSERVVLVRDVERPGFVALCRWMGDACWRLRWAPGGGETIVPKNWPESYRWCELP